MTKKQIVHIHKYKKVNLNRRKNEEFFVYKCIKPGCTHYTPVNLAEGLICECNRCDAIMVIGKQQLYGAHGQPMKYPHCEKCTRRKNPDVQKVIETIEEFLEKKEKQ